jgi:hypothetical protein
MAVPLPTEALEAITGGGIPFSWSFECRASLSVPLVKDRYIKDRKSLTLMSLAPYYKPLHIRKDVYCSVMHCQPVLVPMTPTHSEATEAFCTKIDPYLIAQT